jgi:hypothetical protein
MLCCYGLIIDGAIICSTINPPHEMVTARLLSDMMVAQLSSLACANRAVVSLVTNDILMLSEFHSDIHPGSYLTAKTTQSSLIIQ